MLLSVKLQASACNFTKTDTLPWLFFTFLNCANGTKSCKVSQFVLSETAFTRLVLMSQNLYESFLYGKKI